MNYDDPVKQAIYEKTNELLEGLPHVFGTEKLLEILNEHNKLAGNTHIYTLIHKYNIPHRRLGSKYMFNKYQVVEWLMSNGQDRKNNKPI